MENMLCCSFEAEIKGVMFYEGSRSLTPLTMSHVYFKKDSKNTFHSKAYFVATLQWESKHFRSSSSRKEAEAVDDLFTIPTVKLWVRRIPYYMYLYIYMILMCRLKQSHSITPHNKIAADLCSYSSNCTCLHGDGVLHRIFKGIKFGKFVLLQYNLASYW